MRLRPGLTALWCDATTVQLGTDPRWAVRLGDLTPSAARALRTAPRGGDLAALRSAFAAEEVDSDETDQILDHLASARLLLDAPLPGGQPDEVAWSLLSADADGRSVLTRRGSLAVHVHGLGRLGIGIAGGLAAAGIGTVTAADDGVVGPYDPGPGGYTARDVGEPRAAAAARVLHDVAPTVRTWRRPSDVADLVVLVEHGAADPVRHRPLVAEGAAHLSVVVREASVVVGPLVTPGVGACLQCVDLHRAEQDDLWPAVAAQLVVQGARTHRGEETTVAMAGAALATGQALAYLDGRVPAVRGAAFEVHLPEAVPRHVTWPVHPECGCTGLVRGREPGGHGSTGS